jgi:hypothetical protein
MLLRFVGRTEPFRIKFIEYKRVLLTLTLPQAELQGIFLT